ncbi:MAG: glycerol-3-phosphate dehydrogenase/oxidase [Chloroflexi bacterium]|nr:glycerol-3-phosphate dehydrogenase/oxidase [Chloroflexota bacterium]MCY3587272.1 glycerol-3-phosphate dehydrogenase/oxidase [Chloroflexota bacterium]MCY3686635.1 glycerol-3-phosphate dehydrogenase/oxidase [Chloroflexota bacterium]MDE2709177.1 glycerol-3-phosphate dehydrogenase/oxidase [Chloroflexota bacterium]
MATAHYDVIIIGGGINGAATAAAVAARGYRTLVLEQDDFAAGTTSASTKLIHGGLRYLETGDARLVHESLQSRERLLRERPHLVRPMGFILPVYDGDPRPPWYIRSGLALYDLLSPRKVSPWHSSFSERELQRFEPSISTDHLKAAFLYHDAQVWSPERLTLEYLAAARASGADLRNHSAVDFIIVDGGRARGVDFHDVLTGRRSTASGRLVINAAGPWVDAVLDATGRSMRRRIGGTRGSHLVVDLSGRGPKHAVLASAQSDGRPMFVTPWLDHHIIGTTDVRDDEDPSDVRAAGWEIDYLIAEAARVLPGLGIEHRNVLYAYSGVRPLARAGDGVFEGAISRRSIIADHASEGVERLISVVGGKLTTAAELGRQVAESVAQQIGRPRARGIAALPETPTSRAVFLPPPTQEHLRTVYGPRVPEVAAYAASDASLAEPISAQHRDIGAQVAYAVEHEGARTVADVLLRRTAVGLTRDLGRSAARPTAAIMASRLGWSDDEREQAVRDYFAELHRRFVIINPSISIPPAELLPDDPDQGVDLAQS